MRADLLGRAALFLAAADRLAGRVLGLPADRRHLHVGRLGAVAARPYRHRGGGEPAAAGGRPLAAAAGRWGERPVLRLLCLEIVDPAERSLGGRLCQLVVMVAALVDSLFDDGAR